MINRIIFAAGGTGGHIYPAIAVADELRKVNEKVEIKFIGAKGKIEEKIVPQNGYELETINIQGFKRNLSLRNITAVIKLFGALKKTKKILRSFKPEIVFGTGGYVSGPVLRSASKLGIATVVQEGNYYPGVTTKLLSPMVSKMILNFEGTKEYLKRKDNVTVISYPVRQRLKKIPKADALKLFGLEINKRTLFVFGGSQGASSINTALLKCYKNLTAEGIQVIWQTGSIDYEKLNNTIEDKKDVKIFKYIDNIDTAYSASDLVLCRAGISTIMEIASFGCAAVLVPFPGASENHQEKNARAFAEKNAAELILDNELNQKLESAVSSLIFDETALNRMRKSVQEFADVNASSRIAKLLIGMVNPN